MKKYALLASAASLFAATSAIAADLPSRKVAPVAPIVPAFTWTGFYAGVNAGVNWSSRNINSNIYGTDPVNVDLTPAEAAGLSPIPYSNSRTGFIGGAQIGYNYQINQFVIGAEADFMGMAVNKRSNAFVIGNVETNGGAIELENTISTKIQQNWLGTVRARAGFVVDRALVYATGGLAYGNAKVTSNVTIADNNPVGDFVGFWSGSKQSTKAGFAVGAGVEYVVTNNWLLRAEYLYYNLGSASATALGTSALNNGVPEVNTINAAGRSRTTIDGNIVRAALSYKF